MRLLCSSLFYGKTSVLFSLVSQLQLSVRFFEFLTFSLFIRFSMIIDRFHSLLTLAGLVGSSGRNHSPTYRVLCARFHVFLFTCFALTLAGLVGSSGLEPPTSRLSGARSNQLSYEPSFAPRSGGDDGIRTHDPLLAGQVLSQLSYTPILGPAHFCSFIRAD